MVVKMSSVVKQLMYVLKLFRVTSGIIHSFRICSKETLRIMYPRYPVLDMIQRIDLRWGSFGSITRFWILVKKRKIRFRIKIRNWILAKKRTLNKQNNNFARASRFFVHFFAVFARLGRENVKFRVLWRT